MDGILQWNACVLFGVKLFVQWWSHDFYQLISVGEILDSDQQVKENKK